MAAEETPSASTASWSHDDAERHISSHFSYIWDESFAAPGPMGVGSAPLEVDRRYTKVYDPKTGAEQLTYSVGHFGYEVPRSGGRVAPIDTSLKRVRGGFAPRGVGYKLRMPARFGDGVIWGDEATGAPLVKLVPMRSRASRAGKVVGPKQDKLLFPNVWPASDVVMTATGVGVKDHIIVRDIERAPARYSFIVRRPASARTEVAEDGSVAVKLDGGEPIALMPAPIGQDAKAQSFDIWYTVTNRDSYDVLTLRYSVKPRFEGGKWISYTAPLDIDPELYTDEINPSVDAWGSTSGHTGTVADTAGGLRVQIGKRSAAYVAEAYARWRIGRPPAGASWHSLSGDVAGRVGKNQRYALSTGGINKYVRGPESTDSSYFANHYTFTPPNNESYVVSRIDMTSAASTPFDYYGVLSNTVRTFVDHVDPTVPTISANYGFIAPSTFQATASFSDAQSGCGGGTIHVINDAGTAIRSQSFAGCAATLTFSGVAEGDYTLYVQVRDRAGRTSWNSTWLYVYAAPEVWVESPLDGDYVDGSVLVTGGADSPFLTGYEIYLDGQLKASWPSSASAFSYLLDTRAVGEGERTLTVAARDVAGAATTWDVPIIVDHSAPHVELAEPVDGEHVAGKIVVAADATESVSEVTKVEFLLDGAVIGTRTGEQEYEIELDTLPLSAGSHTLAARATNVLGLARTSTPVTIVVDNIAPSARIITPQHDGTISGTANFAISVDDNFTVANAQLSLYNERNFEIPVGSAAAAGSYAYMLDTTRIQNGSYSLELVVIDKAGNQASVEHHITVANPAYVMGTESWLSTSEVGPLSVGHASGNLSIASTDVDIPALGTTLRVARTYNHQDARVGSFGRGWHASFDRSITIGLDHVATYRDHDGTLHSFYPKDDGGYERAIGLDADITRIDGGGWKMRHLDGESEFYDASGRLLEDVSRTGQTITYARDANGSVYQLGDESGLVVRIERNADGLVAALVDPAGRRTQFGYDADRSLIAATNPIGAITRYGYGSTGWMVTHTDALENLTTIQYADGRVARVINAADIDTALAYGGSSVTTTTATRSTRYELDEVGRAVATEFADDSMEQRSYDEAGHLVEFVNANGDSQTYTYDGVGNRLTETDFEGNNTRYADHNDFGLPRTITSPVGDSTRYKYDDEGNTIKTIKPSGAEIVATFDEAGNTVSETDALGHATTMNYDSHGRLLRSHAPGNAVTTYEVNLAGEVLSETAPHGGETRFTYDAAGNRTSVTDAEGHTKATAYDALDRVISKTDGEGQSTTIEYNAVGNAIKITNPAGGTQTTTYNTFREAVTRTDENGSVTRYTYDAAGHVIAETDPLGGETTYQVDAAGNVISETTPDGSTTEYVYDADGRVIQTTNPDGGSTETTYRADGTVASVTDEEGGITQYGYNADGDQTSMTDPVGNATESLLDANGDIVADIDELGNRTNVELNAQGVPIRSTDREGNQTQTVVDVMGNVTAMTDANGHTTRYAYDKLRRLEQTTDPLGGVNAYNYSANGELTSEIDELGRTTTYAYSPTGEIVAATDPAGGIDRFTYDAAGNVVTDTDADGNTTTYHYDNAGQITASVDPEGLTSRYTYDGDGNLTNETDPAGQTTTYTHDENGRLATVRDPGGEITSYSYNRSGDLTAITDPAGETTAYAYDTAHRVTSQTSSLEGTTTYTYSSRGEMSTVTDAAGTTTYTYTSLGQLSSITLPDGTRTTYTYDPAGNLLTVTELGGTTRYIYDAANRLDSVTTADGTRIEFAYNPAGEVTSQAIDGQTTSYTYTSAGLLASQTNASGTTRFEYTAAGKLTRLSRPNGITTSYTYDNAGLLLSIADSDGDAHTYQHDGAGRITSNRAASGNQEYTYDARGQLTRWTHNGVATLYSYDRHSNLVRIDRNATGVSQGDVPPGVQTHIENCLATSLEDCPNPNVRETIQCLTATVPGCTPAELEGVQAHVARYFANYAVPVRTFTYDAHSRLASLTDELAHTTEQFEYDGRGNQTRAGETVRTYDSENRLIRSTTGSDSVAYSYDSNGMRISRANDGVISRFSYDPDGRLVKQSTPGAPTVQFRYASEMLHTLSLGSNSYFFHFNSRGDTVRITDAGGDTVVRYTYAPWGEATASGMQTVIDANPFTYNGADGVQYDAAVGVYWMGARHYDSRQARFLQTDPEISSDDRADAPYLYAGNDPVNHVDPDGRSISRASASARRVLQRRPRAQVSRPARPRAATRVVSGSPVRRMSARPAPRNAVQRTVNRRSSTHVAVRPNRPLPGQRRALGDAYEADAYSRTVRRASQTIRRKRKARAAEVTVGATCGTFINKKVNGSGKNFLYVGARVKCTVPPGNQRFPNPPGFPPLSTFLSIYGQGDKEPFPTLVASTSIITGHYGTHQIKLYTNSGSNYHTRACGKRTAKVRYWATANSTGAGWNPGEVTQRTETPDTRFGWSKAHPCRDQGTKMKT